MTKNNKTENLTKRIKMQQESLKLNRVQQIKLRQIGKSLKEELKKPEGFLLEIPALVHARLSFSFNPASPYGRHEEQSLIIDSKYFKFDSEERGNYAGYPARDRTSASIYIPLNTSFKTQKITIYGLNKSYPGAPQWNESQYKILLDKPLEKKVGFNTMAQADNFEAMTCTLTFY